MNIYFSENLRALREKRGLTQSKVAEFLGVSFQTISKWERGETYPDITLLPAVSGFFDVSVDDLLGINKDKNEYKINEFISRFDKTYFTDTDKLIKEFDKAVTEFPFDFRLLVRYMELLIETKDRPFIKDPSKIVFTEIKTNDPFESGFIKNPEYETVSKKINSIYEKIQNLCTDDDIRIRAKRIMIRHFMLRYEMSYNEKTGTWRCDFDALENARRIQRKMPALSDTRELLAVDVSNDLPSWNNALEETIEELLFHLQGSLRSYIYFNEKISQEYKIEKIKSINSLFEIIETDEHIRKNEIYIMLNFGQLAYLSSQIGNYEEGFYYLEKCIETAVKLDNNPDEAEIIARFYNLERPLIGNTMCGRMKLIITENFTFAKKFKEDQRFAFLLKKLDHDT